MTDDRIGLIPIVIVTVLKGNHDDLHQIVS